MASSRLALVALAVLTAAAISAPATRAFAADTDWCNDTKQFSAGCQRDCCMSYPREWVHKAPRALCLADCYRKAAQQAVVQKVEEVKQKVETKVEEVKEKAKEIYHETKEAVQNTYQNLKQNVQDGIKKVEQKIDSVANKVKETICSTSAGKVVCDIVKDAAGCYWSLQKTIKDAPAEVKSAIEPLKRWSGGIGAVTASIVTNFSQFRDNVRTAARACWDWVARSAKAVGEAAKEAVCRTSWGKPLCDIIADASDCYHKVKSTLGDAPTEVKNAVNGLAQWQGGIATATKTVLTRLEGLKSQIQSAVQACKDWAGRAAMRVAEELCGKNATCKSFIAELKANGITPQNWTSNKQKVFLVALRYAVPEGATRELSLSASISGAIYKVITGKAGGGVSASATRSADVYTVTFKVTQSGAVGVGVDKSGNEVGASVGAKVSDSATVVLNVNDANDWKQLQMLGLGLAIRGGVTSIFGGVGKVLLAISDFITQRLNVSVPWDARFLSRLSIIQGRSCELCLTADAAAKLNLKGILNINLSGSGETCVSANFDRNQKKLIIGLSTSAQAGAGATLGDKAKDAMGKVSDYIKKISSWLADKVKAKAIDTIEDAAVGSAGFGGSASITYSNVTWPADAMNCPLDAVVRAVSGKKPSLSMSWSISLKWGEKKSRGLNVTLTPSRTPSALDAAMLAMGPMGTFAAFLGAAADSATVAWSATITTGRKLGYEKKESGFGGSVSGELVTTRPAGSGTWNLGEIKKGLMKGTLN